MIKIIILVSMLTVAVNTVGFATAWLAELSHISLRVSEIEKRNDDANAVGCQRSIKGLVFTHSVYREHVRGVDTGALTCFYAKEKK